MPERAPRRLLPESACRFAHASFNDDPPAWVDRPGGRPAGQRNLAPRSLSSRPRHYQIFPIPLDEPN